MSTHEQFPIIPRDKLDFGLESDDIPRYWFGNDPMRTRIFDALSVIFPPGERYFMTSVRAFRDQVKDPQLLSDIRDFMRQEGQHGRVHALYNERLKRQGIDVDTMNQELNAFFDGCTERFSPEYNLALTAATEHLTAILAPALFTRKSVTVDADERMRAMYAWHAVEEIEHKAVAYDVMKKVAKIGYFKRCVAMVRATYHFFHFAMRFQRHMLEQDGFSPAEVRQMMRRRIVWTLGPRGVATPMIGLYLAYFLPGFHPWKQNLMKGYSTWTGEFDKHADPIAAGNALYAAGA